MSDEMFKQAYYAGQKVAAEGLRDVIINTCKESGQDPTFKIIELIANSLITDIELKLSQMENGADIIKILDEVK